MCEMVSTLDKNLCLDLMTYFVLAHPVLEGAAVILKLLLNHQSKFRTRAIITRGLYIFYLIFYCGLYSREVNITDSLCTKKR